MRSLAVTIALTGTVFASSSLLAQNKGVPKRESRTSSLRPARSLIPPPR
jgi:hypothetical protein